MKYINVALLILIFTSSCTQKRSKVVQYSNPNGDSELALLMRQMFDDLMVIKHDIRKGKKDISAPIYEKILTAEPTDESLKEDSFEPFAKAFLMNLKSFKDCEDIDKKDYFNDVINTCIACHQSSCTGPIPRIEKLLIED